MKLAWDCSLELSARARLPVRVLSGPHQRAHQPRKEVLSGSPKKAVGDVCERFSTTLLLVWGRVPVTGIAAAVVVWEPGVMVYGQP